MITFLLKASFVLAVLMGFYRLFLEKESFFATNRSYLLFSLGLTFTLPFICLPKIMDDQGIISGLIKTYVTDESEAAVPVTNIQITASSKDAISSRPNIRSATDSNTAINENNPLATHSESPPLVQNNTTEQFSYPKNDLQYWLRMIYFFGIGIFTLNFLFQIGSVFLKILRSRDKVVDSDYVIINNSMIEEPCSFFKYIFINPDSFEYETYEQILKHEKIHVRKKHSYDLILSEIAIILLWFNPLIWLFRKEVEKNIEYQTDDILINGEQVAKEDYQMNLLKVATYHMPLTITTNYNQSLIKQRIMKISAKKSNPQSLWKYAFTAPMIFTLLLLINQPNNAFAKKENAVIQVIKTDNEKTKATSSLDSFIKEYQKLSEVEKKQLLSILRGPIEEKNQVTSPEKPTTPESVKGKNNTSTKSISDPLLEIMADNNPFEELNDTQKKQVLDALENMDAMGIKDDYSTAIGYSGIIETEKDSTGRRDFVFQIEYKDVEDMEDMMITFRFEDLTEEKIAEVQRVINDIDFHTEAQKREIHRVFTEQKDLEMDDILAVLKGEKIASDFRKTSKIISEPDAEVHLPKEAPCKKLLDAIRTENIQHVKTLLETVGPNCIVNNPGNETFTEGNITWNILRPQTPLVQAGRLDNIEIARLLIDKGADVNFHGKSNETPLMAAAKTGNLNFVKLLVENGAKVTTLVEHWGSAQSIAAGKGHLDIVKYLTGEGADINASVPHVGSTLIEACQGGDLETVKYIVSQKAKINFSEAHVGTPLIVAAENGHLDIVKYLLSKDADIDMTVAHVGTALIVAIQEGHLSTAKYLVSKGADLNKGVAHVGTPLVSAIEIGNEEIAAFLIAKGAKVDQAIPHVDTPLIIAAKEGQMDLIKLLIKQGADIDKKVAHVGTPLICAIENNQKKVAEYLLPKGADINKRVAHVGTPLSTSIESGDLEITKFLAAKGADVNQEIAYVGTPLIIAAKYSHIAIIKYLIAEGADVNKHVAHVGTPLLTAAQGGKMEVVKYLLSNGADVNKHVAHVGTPLLSAAEDGHLKMVELLVNNGADINKHVAHVGTPLLSAAQDGKMEVVKFLVDKGADVNKEVAHVGTPLIAAAHRGEMKIVQYLVSNNADVNKEVAYVGTPISAAKNSGHKEVAKYLRSKGAN